MSIPSEIASLIERLTYELDQIEQETREGLNLAQELLSRFTNNAILTQYFAYFSTIGFFVETSKQQVNTITDTLSAEDVPFEVIQETGQDLGTLLGLGKTVRVCLTFLSGKPIPFDSRSNDLTFQHIAIVVSDMDKAYQHLRKHQVQQVSTAPQRLPEYLTAAAGIEAFYFRDPDGHNLEIIHFPSGKGLSFG